MSTPTPATPTPATPTPATPTPATSRLAASEEARTGSLAERVLEHVRAADPAAQAEVVVMLEDHGLTRFANSFIHQNVSSSSLRIRLRVHAEGRTASGSITVIHADGLTALVERTLAAARLCPPDLHWPGLTPPSPLRSHDVGVDPDIAHAEPASRAQRVRDFVAAATGLETAGFCSTTRRSVSFANSAGQTAWAEVAEAVMDAVARSDGSDGVARLVSRRLADIDGAVLGARAAAKARAGMDPVELPPGRYEVVLEPTAVADVLHMMAVSGFNGKAVGERRSFVELGAARFDPAISLVDDPADAGGAGLPFDMEGTPRRRLVLIDAGVCAAVAHDRRSAAQMRAASTGHASATGAAGGAYPADLLLLPGGTTAVPGRTDAPSTDATAAAPRTAAEEVDGPAADTAVASLVAQVSRGLLVTDNWYTRVLDPKTLVVTGLTRNGVWLIEDGQITAPVQNLRFTQSYPDALAPGAVLAVGSHAVTLPKPWETMTIHTPALRLASWNFTGNASG